MWKAESPAANKGRGADCFIVAVVYDRRLSKLRSIGRLVTSGSAACSDEYSEKLGIVSPSPPWRLSQNSEGGSWNAERTGMSQEIRANYEQMDLLPQALEDWVPADHPARFMREFVEALDMAELGFRERESEEGCPNYAADLLLKVWLQGYLGRIRSTRELERACRKHLSLLWLTGRHAPDHNTLWGFWRENRAALRRVFRAAVKAAAEQGLVGMICHAVDGTKIRAVVSRRTVEHRQELERALEQVEASIAEMEAAVEKAEEE
jgi:transposase